MNQHPRSVDASAAPTEGSAESRAQLRPAVGEEPLVTCTGLEKSYSTARGTLNLFHELDLSVTTGEMVAIVGQSGAGKSTLLHILGALEAPSTGSVRCASLDLARLTPREASAFRNREVGYVWQFHYLLPEFTAVENVALPLLAARGGFGGAQRASPRRTFRR